MEKLLSRAEVAELLGVPVGTLHAWATTGRGPRFAKVGKHARYRRADVDAWVERQMREPQGAA